MGDSNEFDAVAAWASSLDAVQAAPQHHLLLLENDQVRVLETRIGPGEMVPLHAHSWPGVMHVLRWSDLLRRSAAGEVEVDTRGRPAPPSVVWSPPLAPHTLENVGDAELHVISIEIK